MKLEMNRFSRYRVKKGQTLYSISAAFGLPPRVIAARNRLTDEPQAGQILMIPQQTGNLYRVQGGESKTLLCGSEKNFREKNDTDCFYPGQLILL